MSFAARLRRAAPFTPHPTPPPSDAEAVAKAPFENKTVICSFIGIIEFPMCGIVAYIGPREAYPIILKGLKRLEYRGYDSAGVALLNADLRVYKKKGKVAELEDSLVGKDLHAHAGMGHTRWATHGEPNDRNAHPHSSASGRLAMIHNGIIENFTQLKNELIKKGYHFKSDTDTEVLLNFIEEIQKNNSCGLEEAVRIALRRVVGAYVIVLLDRDNPDTIIAALEGGLVLSRLRGNREPLHHVESSLNQLLDLIASRDAA